MKTRGIPIIIFLIQSLQVSPDQYSSTTGRIWAELPPAAGHRLKAAGRRTRRDERSQATENVPKRKYDQGGGDRLGADHLPHFADTASGPARHAMDLVCRLLDGASGWFAHRCLLQTVRTQDKSLVMVNLVQRCRSFRGKYSST
jgi:hypothetical protein